MKLKTIFFLALIVNAGFANGQKTSNVHGKFVGTLQLEPIGDGVHFRVVKTYSYTDPEGHMLQADPGFSTDGASIPRSLWTLIGSPLTGNYLFSAVIHDVGCDSHKYSWQITHRMFYDGMIDKGVGEHYAKLLYWGVRLGGPKWKETTVTASSPEDVKAQIAAQKGEQVGTISAAVANSKLGVPTKPTFEAKMRLSLPETPLTEKQVDDFDRELKQRQSSKQGTLTLDEIDARTPLEGQPETRIFNNNGDNHGFQNNGDNNGTQTIDQSIHINEPPPPPIASFTQRPLPAEPRGQTNNFPVDEGESRFHPGVTLHISVDHLFDDPSFDIACDVACDIVDPFLGHIRGDHMTEIGIHFATHQVTVDGTHHRVSFEDKLSPSAYISLRVRTRTDGPVTVTSVVSTPNPTPH